MSLLRGPEHSLKFYTPNGGTELSTVATPWPADLGIIDTLMAVRSTHQDAPPDSSVAHLFRRTFLDPGDEHKEGADLLLPHMDRFGIAKAMIDVSEDDPVAVATVRDHPDRFISSFFIDPNDGNFGRAGIAALMSAIEALNVRAVTIGPSFYNPPVPIDDRRLFPVYARCEELGIPVFIMCGVPGPARPCAPQEVILIDAVCHFFPRLRVVMRHGGLPWVDLAISLMAKWPNLYYSTSAVAPKHYAPAIVQFANKRAPDRIMFAGYFPRGLSVQRTIEELRDVPFTAPVWPRFLRGNAMEVLGL